MNLKYVICFLLIQLIINNYKTSPLFASILEGTKTDTLPLVLPHNRSDLVESNLRHEAFIRYASHKLPDNIVEWEAYKTKLKNEIIKKTGIVIDHSLPLNIKRTGIKKMQGYAIENISFQTRPGVYATANLYIPDGEGPFPGVINMIGHWQKGKIESAGPQAVGHSLASNGYVCLSIDPWGAGERSTIHGEFEYHGANLGASLLNIGESLIGVQISDNIRGVDLLCSLKTVDPEKIGATGASGGGNQTMWLSAIDERVKAAVPVVSVGTFESYVMRSNCMCETLVDGLTFTEEAGILALSNAIMPINRLKDNPAFISTEMLRSYENAKNVFCMKGKKDHINYKIYDLPHGYAAEDRKAMIGWFNFHLKNMGNCEPIEEESFEQIPEEELMVFKKGERDKNIITTEHYCKSVGNELRTAYLNTNNFNIENKKNQLKEVLKIKEKLELKEAHIFGVFDGWERIALETKNNKVIPLLLSKPVKGNSEYFILTHPLGKNEISDSILTNLRISGKGIVLVDLLGCGEMASEAAAKYDHQREFHTIARAELWLGKTTLGEWTEELNLVTKFIRSNQGAKSITLYGNKETGLAALFSSIFDSHIDEVILKDAPASYLFDNRKTIDFYNMAIHLPGFLVWGDISLAAALSATNVKFINPLTISGQKINETSLREYQSEFEKIRSLCNQPGKTSFINSK